MLFGPIHVRSRLRRRHRRTHRSWRPGERAVQSFASSFSWLQWVPFESKGGLTHDKKNKTQDKSQNNTDKVFSWGTPRMESLVFLFGFPSKPFQKRVPQKYKPVFCSQANRPFDLTVWFSHVNRHRKRLANLLFNSSDPLGN